MSRTYVEISSGTLCEIEKEFNFPTYTDGDSLFVDSELLKTNELGQLVFLPPFHKECKYRHYDGTPCPLEEEILPPYEIEPMPTCKDMNLASLDKFLVRLNESPYYIAHLKGEYYTRDCYIITPAEIHYADRSSFSRYVLSEGNYVIRFDSPFGTITSIETPVEIKEKPYHGVNLCSNYKVFPNEYRKVMDLFKGIDLKPFEDNSQLTILNYSPYIHIVFYDFVNNVKTSVTSKNKISSKPIIKNSVPSTIEIENPIHDYAMRRLTDDLEGLMKVLEENVIHYSDKKDVLLRIAEDSQKYLEQVTAVYQKVVVDKIFCNLKISDEWVDGYPCGCCDGARRTIYDVSSNETLLFKLVIIDSESRFVDEFTSGDSGFVIWKDKNFDPFAVQQMDESAGAGPSAQETSLPDNISVPTPVIPVASEEIIDGIQTEQHDQAIDSTREIVGINSSHTVSSVPSPSGEVEAIDLSVVNGTITIKPDYLPGISLPDYVNRWLPASIESVTNGIIYTPTFSERVAYFSELFTYFHSNVVWKIVSKPPLFQSQRFWVSFNPTINGTPLSVVSDNDLAGFEWNPSENNEIYVVTPWSSINYMDPIETASLGQLIITSRTDLVTEEGLPEPLPIDVYCAPLNMNLYLPKVVNTDSPTPVDNSIYFLQRTIVADAENQTLPVTGNPQLSITSIDSGGIVDFLQDDEGLLYASTSGVVGQRIVKGDLKYRMSGTLSFFCISNSPFSIDGNDAVVINSFPTSNYATHNQVLERQDGDQLIFIGEADDNTADCSVDLAGNTVLTCNSNITRTDLTSDPTVGSGLLTFDNWKGIVQAAVYAVPQMDKFGHNYNGNSSFPTTTLGYIGDHTSRVDNQWGFISSDAVEDISTQIVINLNSPSTLFPYYDRDRHLYYYRYPKIKFTSSSNPSTNLLVRITQTTSPTAIPTIDALQLPGTEWDLKDGAKIIQPYWDKELIALYPTEATCYLQIDVLGGTIGTTPFISSFYNTADMEYFHFVGLTPDTLFDIRSAPVEAEQQMKVTMETPVGNLPASASASRTENSFRYVSTLAITPSTGAVSIPVNARLFGPWNSKHFSRYGKYRGNLKIRLVVTSNRLINGNIHLIHHNSSLSGDLDSSKFLAVLGDIGHSMNGAPGSAIELELDWRTKTPFLPIDFSSNSPDNGYLTIVIPETSTIADSSNLVCTLYTDVSGIQVDLPRSISYSGDYVTISPSIITRV